MGPWWGSQVLFVGLSLGIETEVSIYKGHILLWDFFSPLEKIEAENTFDSNKESWG